MVSSKTATVQLVLTFGENVYNLCFDTHCLRRREAVVRPRCECGDTALRGSKRLTRRSAWHHQCLRIAVPISIFVLWAFLLDRNTVEIVTGCVCARVAISHCRAGLGPPGAAPCHLISTSYGSIFRHFRKAAQDHLGFSEKNHPGMCDTPRRTIWQS